MSKLEWVLVTICSAGSVDFLIWTTGKTSGQGEKAKEIEFIKREN